MNRLATLFLSTTVALGIATVYLAHQVGVARDAADEASVRAETLRARSSRPGAAASSPHRPASLVPASGPACTPASANSTLPDIAAGSAMPEPVASTPAAQRVMQAQTLARVKEAYEDYVEMQELDEEEGGQFYRILVAHEGALGKLATQQPPAPEADYRALEAELKQQLTGLLGEHRTAQLQAYRETGMARMEIQELSSQLDALGMPLSSDQRQRLIRSVVLDRHQFAEPVVAPGEDPEVNLQGLYRDWHNRQRERFGAVARSVLTPTQVKHFEDVEQSRVMLE